MDGVRSLYGATKFASELLIAEYEAAYGLNAIINRCSNIAGPGQMGRLDQGIFSLWVAAHYFGQPLSYVGYGGSGKQVRDFLHVYDFVDLIDCQIARFDRLAGKTFNVGGGRDNSRSIFELTRLCQTVTLNTVPISSQPIGRPNDVSWYISDIRRVVEECEWYPRCRVEEIASDVFEWLESDRRRLKPVFDSFDSTATPR
jgi:CDP-paratose 2-epimerase